MTIELPYDVYRMAERLAERCEWSIEKVIRQALLDAEDLTREFEHRDLERLGELEI